MSVEHVENNPLELNLLGFCYGSKVNIDNTVKGWTLLPQRALLLHDVYINNIEVRRELFRSGYSAKEIARNERPEVSIEAVRQSTLSIPRYFWPARLREVFPSRGTRWSTDDLIFVLRDIMRGLTQSEIAEKYNVNRSRLMNKRDELVSLGFPLTDSLQQEGPSWVNLQKGGNWITLSAALRRIIGKRLRTFDLVCPVLESEGIEVKVKEKKDGEITRSYYFIPIAKVKDVADLYERKPEFFRSRTWSIYPHKENLPKGNLNHD